MGKQSIFDTGKDQYIKGLCFKLATFSKYTLLKMLYCTRALVNKASYCILLVTWLLDNEFSSKSKSVMQVPPPLIE